ncbi:MAG: hypothetical protein PHO93_04545 [Candidatus Saccharimonadaceae bacterium]|nr:hypothetical protein [Candidatus Saccharimonadaceae bacterium]
MFKKIKDPYVKKTLQAIFIFLVGFILLCVTYLVYATVYNITDYLVPKEFVLANSWYESIRMLVVSLALLLGFGFLLKSKLSNIYKAAIMIVPTTIILVVSGVILYENPLASYLLGSLMTFTALAYLHLTKQPWYYWFAIAVVAVSLMVVAMTGVEIQLF